jgi:hypothetical protein
MGHLPQALAKLGQGGDEGAVGLAIPQRGQRAEQQVHAVADLGLGDPDRPAGAPVRQPVQHHRGDRVQADRQRQRRGAALAWRSRWHKVDEAGGQPSTLAGSDDRGRYDNETGPPRKG